jgi:hypothetical protein
MKRVVADIDSEKDRRKERNRTKENIQINKNRKGERNKGIWIQGGKNKRKNKERE